MMIDVKDVIRDVELKPFEKSCKFLADVCNNEIEKHELVATVLGGYKVTLAKLIVGTSTSGTTPLSHAIFKSYDNHGNKMCEAKAINSGDERKFMALKNIAPCHILNLLDGLGAYYQAYNHEIHKWAIVSQRRH